MTGGESLAEGNNESDSLVRSLVDLKDTNQLKWNLKKPVSPTLKLCCYILWFSKQIFGTNLLNES